VISFIFFGWKGYLLADSKILDRVIAVVNNDVILQSELNIEFSLKNSLYKSPDLSEQNKKKLILENMIDELILTQRAERLNIFVEDQTINQVIKNMAERQNHTFDSFKTKLESEGVTFDLLKKNVEKDILLSRLRDRDLQDRLVVSDSEAKFFLDTQAQNNLIADEVLLKHLKIPFKENISVEEKKQKKLDALSKLIKIKTDFQSNKNQFWEKTQIKFEILDWRSFNKLPELFVDSIKNLEAGEFASLTESGSGFHILFLIDRRSSVLKKKITLYKARHILKKVNEGEDENLIYKAIKRIKSRINEGESFSDLAKEYSDDIGSARNGGQLNWAYPGDLVKKFEETVLRLNPGQISEPIRTTFGYHLIEAQEFKEEILNAERQLKIAKMMIRNKKLKEVTDEWMRELRGNSYVEIKWNTF
jgi:peptidyl-prolyl cis-trans isomerase SurA